MLARRPSGPLFRAPRSLIAALAGVLLAAPAALGQTSDVPVDLDETRFLGVGARALSLGGAMQVLGRDATSLAYNPATLARQTRVELSGSLTYRDVERTLERSGAGTVDRGFTTLDHALVSIPTYTDQGNLSFAFGVYKLADTGRDFYMAGTIRPAGGVGSQVVEIDDLRRKGGIWAWTGGVGWQVSRNVSVGATVSYLSGDQRETSVIAHGIPANGSGDEYDLCYQCGTPADSTFKSTVTTDLGLHGWTGSGGFLFDTGSVSVGGTVYLPRWIEYSGPVRDEFQDPYGTFPDLDLYVVDRITLPMSLAGGAGLRFGPLQVAAEAQWTDWSQIDFEGDVRAPDRSLAYRTTVDLRAGVELEAGPFAARVGYAISPLPYRLIAADTVWDFDAGTDGIPGNDDDYSGVLRDYPEADIENDREVLSLGAGLFLDETLHLDAAWTHTSWDRRSIEAYVPQYGYITRESETENRLALTASVLFN